MESDPSFLHRGRGNTCSESGRIDLIGQPHRVFQIRLKGEHRSSTPVPQDEETPTSASLTALDAALQVADSSWTQLPELFSAPTDRA